MISCKRGNYKIYNVINIITVPRERCKMILARFRIKRTLIMVQ